MACNKVPKETRLRETSWGRGWIIEDVWMDKSERYETWEPHVQAIKNQRGDLALRFCYWKRKPDGSRGVFVRSPMFVYDYTIEDLRDEARKCKADVILTLFKKLAE